MIDDSCEVPREDLDDGFNPCRKQVVENGELEAYAHMYDVMSERQDREADVEMLTEELEGKVDRVNNTSTAYRLYGVKANSTDDMVFPIAGNPSAMSNDVSLPNSIAIKQYAPIPLPISKGGTGGTTPHVTDDLDTSAIFVMHDAPNNRYDAAPISSLTHYLNNLYPQLTPIVRLAGGTDLNTITTVGSYSYPADAVNNPSGTSVGGALYVLCYGGSENYLVQIVVSSFGSLFKRANRNSTVWTPWEELGSGSSIPDPLPIANGGTGAKTAAAALEALGAQEKLPKTPSTASADIVYVGNKTTGDVYARSFSEKVGQPETTFLNAGGVRNEISAAFTAHTATTVAGNDLLPTGNAVTSFMNTSLRSVKPLRVPAVSRLTSGTPSVGTVTIIGGNVYEVNGLTTTGNNKIYHVMATIRLKLPNIAAGKNVSIPEFMLFTVKNSMTDLYLSPGSTMVIRPNNKATKFYVGTVPNEDQAVSVDIVSPSMPLPGKTQPNDGILFPATTFFNTSNITLSDNVQLICDLTFYKES